MRGSSNHTSISWLKRARIALACSLRLMCVTFCYQFLCVQVPIQSMEIGNKIKKQGKSEGFDSCGRPGNLKLDSNCQFFRPYDREIWWMTSKKNRALLLYYVKLCASFQIHWWIQTEFTVQKRSIRVGNGDILSRVTLKFDGWPWKTIGHFCATSTFVHHFLAIGGFKQELQSGNAQFGSKLTIFFSRVTFKLDRWPWKTIDHLFYDTLSFVHHFNAIAKFKLKLQPGNAPFGSNSTIFFSRVTSKFYGGPRKTIGRLFYATSSFVHHFVRIGEFKLELQSGNAQFGSNSTIFRAARPWNLTDDLEKQ